MPLAPCESKAGGLSTDGMDRKPAVTKGAERMLPDKTARARHQHRVHDPKSGNAASLAETMRVSLAGHAIWNAGSSQRTPLAYSGW